MSVATEFSPVFVKRSPVGRQGYASIRGLRAVTTPASIGTRAQAPRAQAPRAHASRPRAPKAGRVLVATTANPVRLTRRGIAAAWVATAAVGVLMMLAAYASWSSADAAQSSVRPTGTVRVEPGDTLWTIAGRIAPGRDPRNVVSDLRRVNQLGSAALTPGQVLQVG
jgi:hypothetical protein